MATDVPATGTKRKAGLVAAGVAAAGVIGVGAWAGVSFFSQGAQPAQVLPADTLAYAAVDLDPSGEQKIEAIRFLRKFPGIREELDLEADDDLRRRLFEQVQEDGVCEDLDYDEDVAPWLGERAAAAYVDRGDDDALAFVVQVKDEDEARAGFDKIAECDPEAADHTGGVAFSGEWAIVAETEEIAEGIVADAEESPLADDADYQEVTAEAGDAGVMNFYVAPEAGPALLDELGDEFLDEFEAELGGGAEGEELAERYAGAIEEFPGAAGTLRFDGGDVEFEMATGDFDSETSQLLLLGGDQAGDVTGSLPDSTAAVIAYSLPAGWTDAFLELLGPGIEQDMGMPIEDAIAALEDETGLALPEDVETLLGDGIAVAVDESISADAFEHVDPSMVPAGIRVKGDPAEIEAVLDKLRAMAGPAAGLFVSETAGDYVAVGTNQEYVERLAAGGSLGDRAVFQDVVPHAEDASVIYFIDFDASNWLDELVGEFDDEAAENVEPLSSFGASTWTEDTSMHMLLRLRTE